MLGIANADFHSINLVSFLGQNFSVKCASLFYFRTFKNNLQFLKKSFPSISAHSITSCKTSAVVEWSRKSQEYVKSTICNLLVCLSYFPFHFHSFLFFSHILCQYVNEKDCLDLHNSYCSFLLLFIIAMHVCFWRVAANHKTNRDWNENKVNKEKFIFIKSSSLFIVSHSFCQMQCHSFLYRFKEERSSYRRQMCFQAESFGENGCFRKSFKEF